MITGRFCGVALFNLDSKRLKCGNSLQPRRLQSITQSFQKLLFVQNNLFLYLPSKRVKNTLTHCGRVTQICVFNTVKLGISASSPQCHSTRGNVSRGITPSSTTRVFGEYFLKISVHKSSQRICYKFLKKRSIKVD